MYGLAYHPKYSWSVQLWLLWLTWCWHVLHIVEHVLGTPYINIYTPPPGSGLEKNKKMAGEYYFLMCMQTAQHTADCICTTAGALRSPVVVYIESVAFWSSFHIHQEMVYTSNFLIFLGPDPVVVYIYGVCWTCVAHVYAHAFRLVNLTRMRRRPSPPDPWSLIGISGPQFHRAEFTVVIVVANLVLTCTAQCWTCNAPGVPSHLMSRRRLSLAPTLDW